MPLLSVIVPVYNCELYIRKCCSSLQRQTFKDLEVILVDDGSPDKAGNICESFCNTDHRFKVIHQKNKGAQAARMTGFQIARGQYIGFVDADDWLEPKTYELLMKTAMDNDHYDICIGAYVCDDQNRSIKKFEYSTQAVFDSETALCKMFEGKIFDWSLCDKIYKRDLIEQILVMNGRTDYGEDTIANWKLFHKASKIIFSPIYGYHYNLDDDKSVMHQRVSADQFVYMDIYDSLAREMNQEEVELKKHISDLLIKNALVYLYKMILDDQNFEYEYVRYQFLLKKYTENSKYQFSKYERRIMCLILKAYDVAKKEERERNDKIKDCYYKVSGKNIYIYGAGVIAKEVAQNFNNIGYSYKGFVVTEQNEYENVYGKKIYTFSEVFKNQTGAGFILALNEKNTKEVMSLFKSKQISNYINAGIFSLHY